MLKINNIKENFIQMYFFKYYIALNQFIYNLNIKIF
jgi:hypothetical protein